MLNFNKSVSVFFLIRLTDYKICNRLPSFWPINWLTGWWLPSLLNTQKTRIEADNHNFQCGTPSILTSPEFLQDRCLSHINALLDITSPQKQQNQIRGHITMHNFVQVGIYYQVQLCNLDEFCMSGHGVIKYIQQEWHHKDGQFLQTATINCKLGRLTGKYTWSPSLTIVPDS